MSSEMAIVLAARDVVKGTVPWVDVESVANVQWEKDSV
jgi:hypothetical protein